MAALRTGYCFNSACFTALSSSKLHALVSICIEHYLCNLHPSYQSVSSAFAVFLISFSVGRFVSESWNFCSYILTDQTWQACDFPIYGASQHRVVYQDAEECGEARWPSQNSIKPWNFEAQIDILSVRIVKFQYS